MIDHLMPIFAVIGVLSMLGYTGLAAWAVYDSLFSNKKKPHKHTLSTLPCKTATPRGIKCSRRHTRFAHNGCVAALPRPISKQAV